MCVRVHTHTHTGLPYGKQSSGRGNEACADSIVPPVITGDDSRKKIRAVVGVFMGWLSLQEEEEGEGHLSG